MSLTAEWPQVGSQVPRTLVRCNQAVTAYFTKGLGQGAPPALCSQVLFLGFDSILLNVFMSLSSLSSCNGMGDKTYCENYFF